MKTGFKTSEFWITLLLIVAKKIYPDIPEEAFYTVIAYIMARGGIKLKTNVI